MWDLLVRAKGDGPKVTEPNLRKSRGSLRKSAVSCENLRFPAPSECLNFQEKGWICENLRFSAKIYVLGFLCHLSFGPLSSPRRVACLAESCQMFVLKVGYPCPTLSQLLSEGRGCLEEGCLGLPSVFPDISWTAIFPRKWRKRQQEPELPDLAWNSQMSFFQTSATTRF